MKLKLLVICSAVVGMSLLSSCKKDWNCHCETNGNTDNHEIKNETLLNARAKCKSYEGSVLGVTTTCNLQ